VVAKLILPHEALRQMIIAISTALVEMPEQTELEMFAIEPGAAAN
jgi:hypothetical protein